MSREEVKTAINELLENAPEHALQEVFGYLKSVQEKPDSTVILSQNLRSIIAEDKELLSRLAQ